MRLVHTPQAAADRLDRKYYQAVPAQSLSEYALIAARDCIYQDFIEQCRPRASDMILDVGVSDIVSDAANLVERKYPYPDRITAAGLGAAGEFRETFPKVTYTQIEANRPLPFPDKHFDIATSNAVLEHVGSRANQELFVREMIRVAHCVFISVPNRWFPVEHHTGIPLAHYWEMSFRIACDWLGSRCRGARWVRSRPPVCRGARAIRAFLSGRSAPTSSSCSAHRNPNERRARGRSRSSARGRSGRHSIQLASCSLVGRHRLHLSCGVLAYSRPHLSQGRDRIPRQRRIPD
jgi:hypothetical protein